MKNKAIAVITPIIFLFSLLGCSTLDDSLQKIQVRRSVEDNVFYSSFPEIKLKVDQDLKYLGSARIGQDVTAPEISKKHMNENSLEATSYLFGQIGENNRLMKGIIIRMLVVRGDPSQPVPEMFAQNSTNTLETGEMKILEEQYRYDLSAEQGLFMDEEKALLGSSTAPSCSLVKQLESKAGLGNKSRVQVLYFEDASQVCGTPPCSTCLNAKGLTAEQKQFLQGYTDRSFASIRFMKPRNIEDTTSRYVDTEPKTQPAPPVMAAPAIVPPKAEAAEKRLQAVKDLFDKGLITKEDYEKKKAEILKEL